MLYTPLVKLEQNFDKIDDLEDLDAPFGNGVSMFALPRGRLKASLVSIGGPQIDVNAPQFKPYYAFASPLRMDVMLRLLFDQNLICVCGIPFH